MKDFALQHKNESLYNSHNEIILMYYPFKISVLGGFDVTQKKRNYRFSIISFSIIGISGEFFFLTNKLKTIFCNLSGCQLKQNFNREEIL